MPNIKIKVRKTLLSDGSAVYDVLVFEGSAPEEPSLVLNAVSEKEAYALLDKLVNAINAHTTDDAVAA